MYLASSKIISLNAFYWSSIPDNVCQLNLSRATQSSSSLEPSRLAMSCEWRSSVTSCHAVGDMMITPEVVKTISSGSTWTHSWYLPKPAACPHMNPISEQFSDCASTEVIKPPSERANPRLMFPGNGVEPVLTADDRWVLRYPRPVWHLFPPQTVCGDINEPPVKQEEGEGRGGGEEERRMMGDTALGNRLVIHPRVSVT